MVKKLSLLILFALLACKSTTKTASNSNTDESSQAPATFIITGVSTDKTYGLSPKNPVEVGGSVTDGPYNERRYLSGLAGPNGEPLSFYRLGSCCPIKSDADPFGSGRVMLDNYRVTWEGSKDTISIYINMYDYGELKAPVGFTVRNDF